MLYNSRWMLPILIPAFVVSEMGVMIFKGYVYHIIFTKSEFVDCNNVKNSRYVHYLRKTRINGATV